MRESITSKNFSIRDHTGKTCNEFMASFNKIFKTKRTSCCQGEINVLSLRGK